MADTEELDVKIKANGDNLVAELDKVKQKLDTFSKQSKTITLSTNATAIEKSLTRLSILVDKISGNHNLTINFGSGQISTRLNSIEAKLKSIHNNAKINISASSGTSLTETINKLNRISALTRNKKSVNVTVNSTGIQKTISDLNRLNTILTKVKRNANINILIGSSGNLSTLNKRTSKNADEIKEKYKTLAQEVRLSALDAEKAWVGGAGFKSAKGEFYDALNTLISFRKELGTLSIGQEKGIYANLSRSVSQANPLYTELIDKVKALNSEQQKFNTMTKTTISAPISSSGRINNATIKTNVYNALRDSAVAAAKDVDTAWLTNSTGLDRAEAKFQSILTSMINMKRNSSGLTYGGEGNLLGKLAPELDSSGRAFELLFNRIGLAKDRQKEFNAETKRTIATSRGLREAIEMSLDPYSNLKLIGRASKGTGSAIEASSMFLKEVAKNAGGADTAVGALASKLTGLITAFFVVGETISRIINIVSTFTSVLSSVGGVLFNYVVKPGLETASAMEMMKNGIAGAMTSIATLDGEALPFNQSLQISDGIVKQLAVDAIRTGTSLDAISNTFRSLLEPGLQNNMNITQIEKLASMFTTIGQELQLNSLTIARDTRDIINGMANRTIMAKQLGITDQDVAAAKARGEDLYTWLTTRLQGFVASNKENIKTIGGAFESLKAMWETALASVFDNDTVKNSVLDFINFIKDGIATIYDMKNPNEAAKAQENLGLSPEETSSLEQSQSIIIKLSDPFKQVITLASNFIGILAAAADELITFAQNVTGMDDPVDAITKILSILMGVVLTLTEFFIDLMVSTYDFGELLAPLFEFIKSTAIPQMTFFGGVVRGVASALNAACFAADAFFAAIKGDMSGASAFLEKASASVSDAKKYLVGSTMEFLQNPMGTSSKNKVAPSTQFTEMASKIQNALQNVLKNPYVKFGEQSPNQNALKGIDNATALDDAALQEAKRVLNEQKELVKNNLEDIKDLCKQELDHIGVLNEQGLMTVEDYYAKKNQIEQNQAQAEVSAIQQEISLTQATPFKYDTEKQKELIKLQRELNKAILALNESITSGQEIGTLTAASSTQNQYGNAYAQTADAVSLVQDAIEAALTDGFNAWDGSTMDNLREGCVEAVRKIGSWYSKFLADETTNYIPTLEADAAAAGIPEIPFEEDKLKPGDIIVYENGEHVLLAKGNGMAVGNSSSALDYMYGQGQGPGAVKEQSIYQGQTPTQIIQTGTYGLGISAESNALPNVTTKEGLAFRKALQAKQKAVNDIDNAWAGIMMKGQEQQIQAIKSQYDEMINQYKTQGNTQLVGELLATEASKIREVKEKFLKQELEYDLKSMDISGAIMAGRIGTGTYDFKDNLKSSSDVINHYFDNYFGKDSKIRQAIDEINSLSAQEQDVGNLKAFYDIKQSMDNVFANMAKQFKSFMTAIDDNASFKLSMIEKNTTMTTGQKTEATSRINREKAIADNEVIKSEIANYTYLQDQLSIDMKNALGRNDTQLASVIQSRINTIQFTILPALENQKLLNNEIGKTPELLERVGTAAKQSIEDGLNTFLTDGVNNAQTLSAALNELIIGILKSIQKVFANNLTKQFMNIVFPVGGHTNPSAMTAGGIGNYQNPTSLYSLVSPLFPSTDFAPQYNKNNPANFGKYDFSQNKLNYETSAKSLIPINMPAIKPTISKLSSSLDTVGTSSSLTSLSITSQQLADNFTALNAKVTELVSSMSNLKPTVTPTEAHAEGGIVGGTGTDTSDNIITALSPREGIITAKRVRQLGTGFINSVNRGDWTSVYASIPKFATGGVVGETGAQATARSMDNFATNVGTKVSTTSKFNVALVRDEADAMSHFMRSGDGQQIMLDFSRRNASFINKITR